MKKRATTQSANKVKMKRSQFKALVKECLREILVEDLLLARATQGAIQETYAQEQLMPPQQADSGFINPMDDHAMVNRQNMLMQSALARRQQHTQPSSPGYSPSQMSMLAGIDEAPESTSVLSRNPNSRTPGVRNPSDYISLAAQQPQRNQIYRPDLDTPVNGAPRRQVQQRQMNYQPEPPMQMHAAGSADVGSLSPEMLRAVFDDTAKTTLQEQAREGHIAPGHHAAGQGGMSALGAGDRFDRMASQNDPLDLFGPSAQNWDALAFDK